MIARIGTKMRVLVDEPEMALVYKGDIVRVVQIVDRRPANYVVSHERSGTWYIHGTYLQRVSAIKNKRGGKKHGKRNS